MEVMLMLKDKISADTWKQNDSVGHSFFDRRNKVEKKDFCTVKLGFQRNKLVFLRDRATH